MSRKCLATFIPNSSAGITGFRAVWAYAWLIRSTARRSAWSCAVTEAKVRRLSHMILAATSWTTDCCDSPETCYPEIVEVPHYSVVHMKTGEVAKIRPAEIYDAVVDALIKNGAVISPLSGMYAEGGCIWDD